MKTYQMPRWLTAALLIGLTAIFVLMPFHAFLSTWGGTAIGPLWLWKSWKELLLAGLAGAVAVWLCFHPAVVRELSQRWLVRLLLIYLVVTLVLAAVHSRDGNADAVAVGLAMNLRYLAAAALAYVLARYGNLRKVWFVRMGWFLVGAGLLVAVLGILQALVLPNDFLAQFGYDKGTTIAPATLIDNNPELRRAFATLRGPNDFGAFLILPFLFVLARFRSLPVWAGVSSLLVLGWALVLSGSRSAWLGLLVALAVYAALTARRRWSTRQIGVGIVTVTMVGLLALYAAVNVPIARQAIFHSSPGDPTLTEGSTDNHIAATLGGAERVVTDPLGCGPGCAGPASYYGNEPRISENYFVQIAEETGVVGLSIFLALVGVVALSLYRASQLRGTARVLLSALAGYLVIGLLLHVWADDPLSITWWLLTGAVIGYNGRNVWKKSKDSSPSKT